MTDERWQRKPEKELAEAYGNLKVLPLFFDLPPVNVTTVFVDPGASNAAVRVGEATVAPGPKGTHLSLAGCPAQVPVRVGEEQVGTADGSMRATVVSADPGVCYVLQAAVYGDAADANAPPPQKSNGARVWSIKFLPEKFLERTEASVKAYGKGTYVMQVWRTDC